MSYQPIEDYGIIGNMRTVALVGMNGSPSHGGLVSDSLVHSYPPHPRIEGLPGEEGTYNMCSFWLVEALTRAGLAYPERPDQARLLFERWAMRIILGFMQSRPGRRARRWAISPRPSPISR